MGVYFFSGLFFSSVILKEIVLLGVCAVDYWFSKNIAGKKLCGLLWCQLIIKKKIETFHRNFSHETGVSPLNRSVFWISFYASGGCWLFLFIVNLLTLSFFNMITCLFPTILVLNNLYNFTKCLGTNYSLVDTLKNGLEKMAPNKLEIKIS